MKLILSLVLVVISVRVQGEDFSTAKRRLAKVYLQIGGAKTFYCKCPFDPQTKKVDIQKCGFQTDVYTDRKKRIEYEHVVPQSLIRQFADKEALGDMHNLYPSVGSVNAIRSNLLYGNVPGEQRRFGRCDFEVGGGIAEPNVSVRGDIARAFFYMMENYGIDVEVEFYNQLVDWDELDPPDRKECLRNRLIKEQQGNDNWHITIGC